MVDAISVAALIISIISLLVLIYFLLVRFNPSNLKKIYSESLESTLTRTQIMKDQFKASVAELRIDTYLSAISETTRSLSEHQRSLTDIFTNKSSRGYFGERQLEDILKDYFGSDWIHVREKISSDIEIPDIYFDTPQGKLCIDAKFPLENYKKIVGAKDEKERSSADNDFSKDFKRHVKKVSGYVKPESGTARIALMYVPAESIYAYVAEDHPEWMDDAAKVNVLIVSPSSLIPQLVVVRSYVDAEKIVKYTDKIKRRIEGYQSDMGHILSEWSTLRQHIENSKKKALEMDDKLVQFNANFGGLLDGLSEQSEMKSNEKISNG
ncbi:MAG: DNA recombination protein RmuC [Conexivisphaerales archaeon]